MGIGDRWCVLGYLFRETLVWGRKAVIHAWRSSSASSPLSSWALACASAQCGRWRRVREAFSTDRSCDQVLIGEPLARHALNEAVLQGMPLYIALVEPENELINVPAKVFRADMVKRAVTT
jgi:hypothetical protein